jgi:hypothetical protein
VLSSNAAFLPSGTNDELGNLSSERNTRLVATVQPMRRAFFTSRIGSLPSSKSKTECHLFWRTNTLYPDSFFVATTRTIPFGIQGLAIIPPPRVAGSASIFLLPCRDFRVDRSNGRGHPPLTTTAVHESMVSAPRTNPEHRRHNDT